MSTQPGTVSTRPLRLTSADIANGPGDVVVRVAVTSAGDAVVRLPRPVAAGMARYCTVASTGRTGAVQVPVEFATVIVGVSPTVTSGSSPAAWTGPEPTRPSSSSCP